MPRDTFRTRELGRMSMRLASIEPVTITTQGGLRVHAIQTGWVVVKAAHYFLRRPAALRLLRIVLDRGWVMPMPIMCWIIEHPAGLLVIDTGEVAAATNIATYMAADPNNAWFFGRNLRFFVSPEVELAAQMRGLNLDPHAVRWVVLTHLHEDHAAGLHFFPHAEMVISRREFEHQQRRPLGAVPSLWPPNFAPRLIDYHDGPFANLPATHALTPNGDVLLIPTPGHSYGHQSVLLRDGSLNYLFAGDLAFSQRQLLEQELQGISQDLHAARRTLQTVRQFVLSTPTVFLPSHDPRSAARLAEAEVVAV